MIELERVSHRYGDLLAVDDVSLTCARGTITVLVGTSGSGKSTLLRMINRLVVPARGTVRIDGVDTATVPVQTLRRGIGYVIQGNGLFPHWSVARNVATVPRLLGWPAARIDARVRELLTLLNLDPDAYAHKLPHQLSGGQQQRVGVARALAAQPAILLMDEPFGALDPVLRTRAQDELLALQRRLAITVVLVSHDMDEALRLGDQIVVMDGGRIVQAGAPAHLLAHPAPGLVEQLVSGWGDRPFRLLALARVDDVAQAGLVDQGVADGLVEGQTGRAPLPASASLRDALTQMLWRGLDRLAVIDADGVVRRHVTLAAIIARARAPG